MIEFSEKRRDDVLFLYAEKIGFYESFGFQLVEEEPLAIFKRPLLSNHKAVPLLKRFEVSAISEKDASKIWRSLEKIKVQEKEEFLSFQEWKKILKTPQMTLFFSETSLGIPVISFFGKADDFKEVHHGFYAERDEDLIEHLEAVSHLLQKDLMLFLPRSRLKMLPRMPSATFYIRSKQHEIIDLFINQKLWIRSFHSI